MYFEIHIIFFGLIIESWNIFLLKLFCELVSRLNILLELGNTDFERLSLIMRTQVWDLLRSLTGTSGNCLCTFRLSYHSCFFRGRKADLETIIDHPPQRGF